jgi:exopolysaccharide production protein ExoZ
MKRLYNLDYLRGLAAFGIMIYHYLTWTLGKFEADTFMGRLGLYGVSIFYVLSGLTLFYVYFDKIKINQQDIFLFFKKRILRIYPLLWLVTIIAILLSNQTPNIFDIFLNLSGLFGFIKWDSYFSEGVWSIGNELVFYVFFPFFILFAKSYRLLFIFLSIIIFSIYLFFAFVKLNPELLIQEQWKNYVNPLNQIFLFLGGFLIGFLFHKAKFNNYIIIIILLLSFVLFVYFPVFGNTIKLVTGLNRILFTVLCFIICLCFYKLSLKLPHFIHQPLTLLGEASYSVYLLHPIIYKIVGILRDNTVAFSESLRLLLSVLLTLIISYLSYEYFEKYFMKLGKTLKN